MADLAAGDVTYTMIKRRNVNSKKMNVVKLAFGNASLTVPSGGIPLSKGKLGCPNTVESLIVYDQSTSGYKYQYDFVNEKLIVMQSPSHAHDVLIKGGQAAAGTAATAWYATDIFGKEAATDKTITGTDSATKGGVQSSTAVALSQASTVAIAAQTLYVEVIGW